MAGDGLPQYITAITAFADKILHPGKILRRIKKSAGRYPSAEPVEANNPVEDNFVALDKLLQRSHVSGSNF